MACVRELSRTRPVPRFEKGERKRLTVWSRMEYKNEAKQSADQEMAKYDYINV
jgi:hypothetical protein